MYTIIDGDGYVEEAEEIHSSQDFLSNPRSSTKDFKTRLSEQVLRKRRVRKEEANVTSNTEFSGKKTVVAHYSPAMPFENKEHVIQRDPQEPRNLEFPFSEMHVMASFPVIDGDESNKENDASKKTNQNNLTSQSLQTPVEPQKMKRIEKRLLTIRKFQNGILSFTPDVTKKDQKSYRIQVEDQIYDYRIENVSEPMDTLDEEKEMKIYTEFYQK